MENNDAKIFEYKSESNLPNRKLIRERLPPTETKISFDEQSSLSELNLCMDDVKPEVNGNSVAEVCDIEKTKLTSKRVAFRSQSLRSTASDCHPGLLLQKKNLLLRDTSFQVCIFSLHFSVNFWEHINCHALLMGTVFSNSTVTKHR